MSNVRMLEVDLHVDVAYGLFKTDLNTQGH
jgi:hypothetical protein